MLTYIWYVFVRSIVLYVAIKIIDYLVAAYYLEKIRALKYHYEEELDEEPSIDPLYNVTQDIYFYYYKLGVHPIWNFSGQSRLIYVYYQQFKERAEDYCMIKDV